MKKIIFPIVLLLVHSTMVTAGQSVKPDSAQAILRAAVEQANASHKTVLVMFHASWCSWCRRLDAALMSPELQSIIKEHFVLTHIDVMERKEKIDSLENPGGVALMKTWGGEKSGLPFLVFLDVRGNKAGDSNVMPDHQNIGYPGSEEEIAAFVLLLKKNAPRITEQQLVQITTYLEQHAPKH
ncbi:MAG TPA: thioredoxin family protein [Bacteroidota bacterium]|nr:thioredoxin family protein [Bacteroidota bacterium]